MTNPLKKRELFYHKIPLQTIKSLERTNYGKIVKTGKGASIKVRMKAVGKEYEIKMRADYFTNKPQSFKFGTSEKKVNFNGNQNNLILEKIFFNNHSNNVLTGQISSFYSKGYSKKINYRYRLIIPLLKELHFHYQIEETVFESDLGYSTRNGVTCAIGGEIFHVHIIHDKEKNYFLSIHSQGKQSFKSFSEKAFSVKNGIGYMTGYLAGDKGYFFAYSNAKMETPKHVYFVTFRKTIQSFYSPIHSNPYSWTSSIPRKTADSLSKRGDIKPISQDIFSGLCQKLHESTEFTSVIMLILESATASLLFMPGGFAIALESLSKLILEESKPEKLKPVPSKIMKGILKQYKEIIDQYSAEITPEIRSLMHHRLEQINQPTNKAKLRLPFELLGLDLSEKDLQILDSRNDFLHGQIPDITKAGKERSLERKNKDMHYAALRFSTLLNKLIFKWLTYDGHILNQVRIHGKSTGIRCNEPYYIKL